MKLHFVLSMCICGLCVYTLGNLITNVAVVDHVSYIVDVVTETVQKVEARGWCNFKVPDAGPVPIDEMLLNWHAKGSVRYTNGFVVSIQGLNMPQRTVTAQILNHEGSARAHIRGNLSLYDVAVGFDVLANLEDGARRYTAKYVYNEVNLMFNITKTINSSDISLIINGSVIDTEGSLPIFMPSDRLSDALTSLFNSSMFIDDIVAWAADVFHPIALDIITYQVQFPEICYNC